MKMYTILLTSVNCLEQRHGRSVSRFNITGKIAILMDFMFWASYQKSSSVFRSACHGVAHTKTWCDWSGWYFAGFFFSLLLGFVPFAILSFWLEVGVVVTLVRDVWGENHQNRRSESQNMDFEYINYVNMKKSSTIYACHVTVSGI